VQQLRRLLACAALATAAQVGCAAPPPDRLDLVIRRAEGTPAPVSLLVRIRDDGPPRAVAASVYIPPLDAADGLQQTIALRPNEPFAGTVAVYVIGCARTATCVQGDTVEAACVCEAPIAFGAGVARVDGPTRMVLDLLPFEPTCDADGDLVVSCAAGPACCAGVPELVRRAVSDCADGAAAAHPFLPSEPSAEAVLGDAALQARNRAFCGDGLDNDCADGLDSECARLDADGDGYFADGAAGERDCDDGNLNVNPGMPENCANAVDDDCDGVVAVCDADGDGASGTQDCDDADPTRYFGALDPCGDRIDQDCDGIDLPCVPEDLDGDGYSCVGTAIGGDHRCAGPGSDCDDLNAAVHPGAPERCDDPASPTRVDENCDGVAEVCPEGDRDGDGVRDRALGGSDCNDQDALIRPGAAERCGDDVDQDCDGRDAPCGGTQDADGDGWPASVDCNDQPGAGATIGPGAVEVCNGVDDDCDGVADEGNPLATVAGGPSAPERCGDDCPGATPCGCYSAPNVCSPDPAAKGRKIVLCIGIPAGAFEDICNGSDDDCDGRLDNAPGGDAALRQDCYTGPGGTEGVGPCIGGTRTCESPAGANAAVWSDTCFDEVIPSPEVCNAVDDDCNGEDNDRPEGGFLREACYPCGAGMPGAGICRRGERVCDVLGWGPCDGQVCPRNETCNDIDDDCNGTTDDAPGAGDRCANGVGACERPGQRVCNGRTGELVCNAVPGAPEPEACNGEDDNCDGRTDEGFGLGDACSEGVGACQEGGRLVCGRGGRAVCDARPGMPAAERCNGIDDDCDGSADLVGGAAIAQSCYGGPANTAGRGICRNGTQTCVGGMFGACEGETRPQAETCNGLDDDCNGSVDDDLVQDCDTGRPAPCSTGRRTCVAGAFGECVVQPRAVAEACNGLDDDCDGDVDEGLGVGAPCSAGMGACVTPGMIVCAGNAAVCDASPPEGTPETCNGADDDCDGNVDDEMDEYCRSHGGNRCGGMERCRCGDSGACAAPQTCQQGGNGEWRCQ
jgi:hypothetical protein